MENDILQALSKLLDEKLRPITQELSSINKKIDGLVEQTADLTEFRTETKKGIEAVQKDISKLTNVTKINCFEIADLKAVR